MFERAPLCFDIYSTVVSRLFPFRDHVCAQWYWVIAVTIVAAGTSIPELITSIVAAFKGKTDLAIGNVVGSSLLNQLLVLGSCALVSGNKGLQVDNLLIERDIPLMIIATLACMPIFWTNG